MGMERQYIYILTWQNHDRTNYLSFKLIKKKLSSRFWLFRFWQCCIYEEKIRVATSIHSKFCHCVLPLEFRTESVELRNREKNLRWEGFVVKRVLQTKKTILRLAALLLLLRTRKIVFLRSLMKINKKLFSGRTLTEMVSYVTMFID